VPTADALQPFTIGFELSMAAFAPASAPIERDAPPPSMMPVSHVFVMGPETAPWSRVTSPVLLSV
jgi:hypothetical protein